MALYVNASLDCRFELCPQLCFDLGVCEKLTLKKENKKEGNN